MYNFDSITRKTRKSWIASSEDSAELSPLRPLLVVCGFVVSSRLLHPNNDRDLGDVSVEIEEKGDRTGEYYESKGSEAERKRRVVSGPYTLTRKTRKLGK
jgi:hypothetical protein